MGLSLPGGLETTLILYPETDERGIMPITAPLIAGQPQATTQARAE